MYIAMFHFFFFGKIVFDFIPRLNHEVKKYVWCFYYMFVHILERKEIIPKAKLNKKILGICVPKVKIYNIWGTPEELLEVNKYFLIKKKNSNKLKLDVRNFIKISRVGIIWFGFVIIIFCVGFLILSKNSIP